jgi:hypothetical protein
MTDTFNRMKGRVSSGLVRSDSGFRDGNTEPSLSNRELARGLKRRPMKSSGRSQRRKNAR